MRESRGGSLKWALALQVAHTPLEKSAPGFRDTSIDYLYCPWENLPGSLPVRSQIAPRNGFRNAWETGRL